MTICGVCHQASPSASPRSTRPGGSRARRGAARGGGSPPTRRARTHKAVLMAGLVDEVRRRDPEERGCCDRRDGVGRPEPDPPDENRRDRDEQERHGAQRPGARAGDEEERRREQHLLRPAVVLAPEDAAGLAVRSMLHHQPDLAVVSVERPSSRAEEDSAKDDSSGRCKATDRGRTPVPRPRRPADRGPRMGDRNAHDAPTRLRAWSALHEEDSEVQQEDNRRKQDERRRGTEQAEVMEAAGKARDGRRMRIAAARRRRAHKRRHGRPTRATTGTSQMRYWGAAPVQRTVVAIVVAIASTTISLSCVDRRRRSMSGRPAPPRRSRP